MTIIDSPSSQVSGTHDFEAIYITLDNRRQASPLSIAALTSFGYRVATRLRRVFDSYSNLIFKASPLPERLSNANSFWLGGC